MESSQQSVYHFIVVVITAVSLGLRLHNIEEPAHVCWDEAHVGKYVSNYLNRTFFFDVHPPLGKLMLAAAAVHSGYNGDFNFSKPQEPYGHVEYVGMRQFVAVTGSLIVPLCAGIVWELSRSVTAVALTGIMVLSDTSLTTISRLILLDPILMFFIVFTCFCYLKHHNSGSFTTEWWLWLSLTGGALGAAVSVKFVGIFLIIFIGLSTVKLLWGSCCDSTLSLETIVQLVVARIYTLVAIPIALYCFVFAVHFILLNHSGPGENFFSSEFQISLEENHLHRAMMPEFLSYGSKITLKNRRTSGTYLHSNAGLTAETGFTRQLMSTYYHQSSNNIWIVENVDGSGQGDKVVYVRNGDTIRLKHYNTKTIVKVDNKSSRNASLYCATMADGDNSAQFKIKIISGRREHNKFSPVATVFQLVDENENCFIKSENRRLSKWGSDHHSVICSDDQHAVSTYWNVEILQDDRQHTVKLNTLINRPGFLGKFTESHSIMYKENHDLQPELEGFDSRPWMWPLVYKTQLLSADPHIILIGNPVLHWSILGVICISVVAFLAKIVILQRLKAYNDSQQQVELDPIYKRTGWLFLGWFLHYAPFWFMKRVLYTHHYIPALLFSCMYAGLWIDHILGRISRLLSVQFACYVHWFMVMSIGTAMMMSFYMFSPLVYGLKDDSVDAIEHLMWLSSWDW